MNTQAMTFERLPDAIGYLINMVEGLENALKERNEQVTPAAIDRWLSLTELMDYLPDHPAKSTIYDWVSEKKIPNHKGPKKLRFLKSEIDKWLATDKRTSDDELQAKASEYCSRKKGAHHE